MSMTPEGSYPAIAVQNEDGSWFQIGESKEKKTKQIVVNVKITSGEYAGRVRAWFGYITPDTVDRTLDAMRTFGFKGDDLSVDEPLTNPINIVIKHEPYNGKIQEKIAWINKPGGSGMKLERQLTGEDRRLFAAGLKERMKAKPVVIASITPPPVVTNGTSGKPAIDPEI